MHHKIKNLRQQIVSIHVNFHQNRFINECERKEKAKISALRKDGVFYKM